MRSEDTRSVDWRDEEVFPRGMLMGAWHRRGGGGLQERLVHRKVSLWLFICGLAALQWRPYHHNGHRGEDTTREHTRHIVKHTMSGGVRATWVYVWKMTAHTHTRARTVYPLAFFTFLFLLVRAFCNFMFHFLFVSSCQSYRTREGFCSKISPSSLYRPSVPTCNFL